MKRILALTICMALMFGMVNSYAAGGVKVYAPDGRSETILASDVPAWKAVGWYTYPVITVYAPDGRKEIIEKEKLDAWLNVGWLYEPAKVTLYSKDGRKLTIHKGEVDTYLSLGWYRLSEVPDFKVSRETNPEIKVLEEYAYSDLKNYKFDSGICMVSFDNITDARLYDCDNDGELEMIATYSVCTNVYEGYMVVFDANQSDVVAFCPRLTACDNNGMIWGVGIRYYNGLYYLYDERHDNNSTFVAQVYLLDNKTLSKIERIDTDSWNIWYKFRDKYREVMGVDEKPRKIPPKEEILSKCFDMNPVTVYCRNNYSTKDVYPHEIGKNLKDYYTYDEKMMIYNGETYKKISKVGWPKYAEEGGWHTSPVIKMYAPQGKTALVDPGAVDAWEKVGWYTYPVMTVYAPNGRTSVIAQKDLSAWENVGWYKTYEEAKKASEPEYYDDTNDSNDSDYDDDYNQPNSGGSAVYRTPSGKKYHFDSDCGGKNSYQTTLQDAKNSGLTPCSKCAY